MYNHSKIYDNLYLQLTYKNILFHVQHKQNLNHKQITIGNKTNYFFPFFPAFEPDFLGLGERFFFASTSGSASAGFSMNF